MANRRGADYIEALRDGREVWHAGRRIEDVTIHSGFSGTIKTLADLYDKQHLPEYKDIMTVDYEGERIFVYKDPRLLAGIHYIHTKGAVLDYVAPHHQAGGVPRRCPAFDPMERA